MSLKKELDLLLKDSSKEFASKKDLQSAQGLLLYGAGTLGREVLQKLSGLDLKVLGLVDNTTEKIGTTLEGIKIFQESEASVQFSQETPIVVTIFNPKASFVKIRQDLQKMGWNHVYSYAELAFCFPDTFLPTYFFQKPSEIFKSREAILKAAQLFEESESQDQFLKHLRFRLHLDFENLPQPLKEGYFPQDLTGIPQKRPTFVDAGAFDGDTVEQVLKSYPQAFGKIIALEPDQTNYQKLEKYVASLPKENSLCLELHHAALGAQEGLQSFCEQNSMASQLNAAGDQQVQVKTLDGMLGESSPWIKLDVEGAERDALEGAKELIATKTPRFAISLYHKPCDLWEIPLYLQSLSANYHFFLRTQAHDGMDLVLYALPKESLQ